MSAAANLDVNPLHPDAARIARGVTRLFGELAWTSVTELTLANRRRADICALGPHGEITIVEIKSSVADFRSDAKWPEYQPYCDRFYFAVGHDFPKDLIPDEAGLIVADGFGGAILRDPGETTLKAARRKAMMLRFAHAAAGRLMRLDGRAVPD
ncbi:MAG: MmcB family DNA repair protein [Pseudomonadota bacterium]